MQIGLEMVMGIRLRDTPRVILSNEKKISYANTVSLYLSIYISRRYQICHLRIEGYVSSINDKSDVTVIIPKNILGECEK